MKILVSACLLGSMVRWNNSSKKCTFLEEWARNNQVELIPICPEDEAFGTPRKPIKLIQIEDKIEYNLGQEDVYPELKEKVDEIQSRYNDASGFIGIFGSPTCGIGVGVKNKGGFTRGLMHVNSPFPTTEIGHFKNLNSRKVFLEKIRKEDTL